MSESIDERYQQFMTVPIGKYIGTTTLVYDMHAEITRLRRENAELVEALEFYADPDTYATGDLPSVNWKHGEAYSYCPECGRQEPLRRSATETKDVQS